MSKYNEDSRVKIPTILHLMRLGYQYLSLKDNKWDLETNIFTDIFHTSIQRLNPNLTASDIDRCITDLKLILDNEDLGEAFYKKLCDQSNIKLIDFANFDNNSFHVVTEQTCQNDDEEFRPDITLIINGMPLAFIEVKKPNNRKGVIAERDRIVTRSQNPKFRRFINITQFMIFSNNMEYDDNDIEPIQGAYYASPSYGKYHFNYFREEQNYEDIATLNELTEADEYFVLKDTNYVSIKNTPEFQTNKSANTPTNRLCTSLLSKDRLAFILQFSLAYVRESSGLQKHIMRYPQMFATKAIANTLDNDIRKGIIWHTQGSGKTALTYFNVKFLTAYFQQKQIIPKFYFIVDRISLLEQAKKEFTARGLKVITVSSREEFAKDIKATQAIHNDAGIPEITVVNIHKFKDDKDVIKHNDYNINIQRVYFLDEVHRSYDPNGSFLANLEQSDTNAIKIGLTGTPLIGENKQSKQLFGSYIHKYYYDASIADGYTLRLIREAISTEYKLKLSKALADLEVEKGSIKIKDAFAKPKFVSPMLDYILDDFEKSRKRFEDPSLGAMVICVSSDQAKALYEHFQDKVTQGVSNKYSAKTSAVILHDVGTKEERKDWVDAYKAGKIDVLFVYNMLLTGFDAPRLKKLYMTRVIKEHGLLQALTRVNRTYKDYRYGYVVDFADITQEFEATNKAYFAELQEQLGDEIENYTQLFKSQEDIKQEIEEIKDHLFKFNTENAELFTQQISEIEDKSNILALQKVLNNAKSLYNIIRFQGDYEQLEHLDFDKLNILLRATQDRLAMMNLKDAIDSGMGNDSLLNEALENVVFDFKKIGEEELILADKLRNTLKSTRETLAGNFDKKDPEFVSLREELERLFKTKNLSEVSQEQLQVNIENLEALQRKAKALNSENERIRNIFGGDAKYMRIHKRLFEKEQHSHSLNLTERNISEYLNEIKVKVDHMIYNSSDILNNENYFEKSTMGIIRRKYRDLHDTNLDKDTSDFINQLVTAEYSSEYHTGYVA